MSVGTLLCSEDCETFSPHKAAVIKFVIAVIKFMFSPLTFFLTLESPIIREKEKTCHGEKFRSLIMKSAMKQNTHWFQQELSISLSYINSWGTWLLLGRQNKYEEKAEEETPNSTWKRRKTKQRLLFHGTEHPRRNKSSLDAFTCASPDLEEDAGPADRFSGGFAYWTSAMLCLTKLEERAEDVGDECFLEGGCRYLGGSSFWVSKSLAKSDTWGILLSLFQELSFVLPRTAPDQCCIPSASSTTGARPSSHGDRPSVVCETETSDVSPVPVTQACCVLPPSSHPRGREAHVHISLLGLAAPRNASPGRWSLLGRATLQSTSCPASGSWVWQRNEESSIAK